MHVGKHTNINTPIGYILNANLPIGVKFGTRQLNGFSVVSLSLLLLGNRGLPNKLKIHTVVLTSMT